MTAAKIIKFQPKRKTTPSSGLEEGLYTLSRFRKEKVAQVLDKLYKCGDPIFVPEDIMATTDAFAKLLRMYCVDQNITWDYFNRNHAAYCESMGYSPTQRNYDKNNVKRSLLKPTMTKSCFEYICGVLNLIISDMSVTLVTPDGSVPTYRLSDVIAGSTKSFNLYCDPKETVRIISSVHTG